ncbi:DUF4136 domain-containing protein [Rubritalea marina]|uniref:DUF4136 domain-containing protein n=1 Tax=Rubritalea marina TaxID=361055 RepID=UPI00146140A3|nr:DUF4136 domain-containing protein [Rubritalea marina]
MTKLRLLLAGLCAFAMASCSNSIDMPKGSSSGYSSARIVKRAPNSQPITDPVEKKVHRLIHSNIQNQFTSRGMGFNSSNSDLVVAYMVIYQDSSTTTSYDEYFGYHRDSTEILDRAHEIGVIKEKNPDYFERAGLLVDIIDSKTNKLVYRNIGVVDVVNSPTEKERANRVSTAVNEAISPFFK